MNKYITISMMLLLLISSVSANSIDVDYKFWFENASTKCFAQLWIEGDNVLDKSWTIDNDEDNKDSNDFNHNIDDYCDDSCQDFTCPSLNCPSVNCPEASCNCPNLDLSQIPACPGLDCPNCEADCPEYNLSQVYDKGKEKNLQDMLMGIGIGFLIGAGALGLFIASKGVNVFSIINGRPPTGPQQIQGQQIKTINLPRSK